MRRGWSRLGKNAKWLLVTEPGWSIPMPSVFYYQALYAVSLGLGEVEYGLLISFSRALSVLTPLLAVPVASRLGFKKAFLLIDLLANAGFLLPLIAGELELLPAAFALSSLLSASSILWEVLLVAGTGEEALITAYSLSTVIYIIGSSLPPIAGVAMQRWGVVYGYRLISLVTLACFLAKTAVLALKLEEPQETPTRGEGRYPSFLHSMKSVLSERSTALLLLYFVLSSFLYSIIGYLSLYLHDQRGAGMTLEEAGLVSTIASLVSLLIVSLVTVRPLNPLKYLFASSLAGSLASLLFSLSTLSREAAFLAAAAWGLRGAEFSVSRALFILLLGGGVVQKGHAISLAYTLSNVFGIPAPAVTGFLYSIHPVAIWVLALAASLAQVATIACLRNAVK